MSKYQKLGAYHYLHYKTKGSPYQKHVDDVVAHVCSLVPKGCQVADLGCGEGLVVDVLRQNGVAAYGFDIDEHAIALGRELDNAVLRLDITQLSGYLVDVVLLLDVLEHVHAWEKVIDNLCDDHDLGFGVVKSDVKWIFLALPDRPDPFAVDDDDHEERHRTIADYIKDKGFRDTHYERRQARHFYVFER